MLRERGEGVLINTGVDNSNYGVMVIDGLCKFGGSPFSRKGELMLWRLPQEDGAQR